MNPSIISGVSPPPLIIGNIHRIEVLFDKVSIVIHCGENMSLINKWHMHSRISCKQKIRIRWSSYPHLIMKSLKRMSELYAIPTVEVHQVLLI